MKILLWKRMVITINKKVQYSIPIHIKNKAIQRKKENKKVIKNIIIVIFKPVIHHIATR